MIKIKKTFVWLDVLERLNHFPIKDWSSFILDAYFCDTIIDKNGYRALNIEIDY